MRKSIIIFLMTAWLVNAETQKNVNGAFISRWPFRDIAQFMYEPDRESFRQGKLVGDFFDPQKVKAGDIIFVRYPGAFFEHVHPKIQHPYILITGGDVTDGFKNSYIPFLRDPKLIKWFGIHAGVKAHPKFVPIPLGVNGIKSLYDNMEETNAFFKELSEQPKKYLVYMNFESAHRADRKLCLKLFEKKPFCLKGSRKPFREYCTEMATCKFTLSPRGIGIDCYRTWEALLVGSYPIVASSQLDPLFEGLPVLIIKDWRILTESYLKKKYEEMKEKKYDYQRLFAGFWLEKIRDTQRQFLAEYAE